VAKDLLITQLTPLDDEPTRLNEVIQAMYTKDGMVTISPDLAHWTDDLWRSLGTEAELQGLRREMEETVLDPPLSQVILEMRGPKQ